MVQKSPGEPEDWDERHSIGSIRRLLGSADRHREAVASRHPGLIRGYLWIALVVVTINALNVTTVLSDSARYGAALPAWKPALWELTSALATLLSCWLAYLAIKAAAPGRSSLPHFFAVHVLASLAFSFCHVFGMYLLRIAIYFSLDQTYTFEGLDFLYEYRKDILGYFLIATIFWVASRTALSPKEPLDNSDRVFEIRDGQTRVKVRKHDIVAAKAAGNYVEFFLTNGRNPLMRTSLTNLEDVLSDSGIVRTHRSWIVNPQHVLEISPSGSGDFSLRTKGGVLVPCSRRYKDSLNQVRQTFDQI